ncbi:MAG TPA: EamA family transporter [Patescibacteria group bacterium]|jgi:drug/metabolite transporter (DMT)-like permease|nr:EamA family transporter [Patescibacteria group bacterium]
MQYILAVSVALMLVAGQSLWKIGIMQMPGSGSLAQKLTAVALSPAILGGCFIYLIATLLYMYTIGKYEYSTSYAMIVSASLIIATIAASIIFHEKISPINILGVAIILCGVLLVLKR